MRGGVGKYDNTNCKWNARYSQHRIILGTGRLGNKKKSGNHPNHRIIEIDQNIGNIPGDLREFAFSKTPVEKPSANDVVKKPQMTKIIIIMIIIIIISDGDSSYN